MISGRAETCHHSERYAARLSRRLDHLVQSGFSYMYRSHFEGTYRQAPPFEQVLDTTRVALPLMPDDMGFLQEREYRFWLHTEIGRIHARLRVLPAKRPDAPAASLSSRVL